MLATCQFPTLPAAPSFSCRADWAHGHLAVRTRSPGTWCGSPCLGLPRALAKSMVWPVCHPEGAPRPIISELQRCPGIYCFTFTGHEAQVTGLWAVQTTQYPFSSDSVTLGWCPKGTEDTGKDAFSGNGQPGAWYEPGLPQLSCRSADLDSKSTQFHVTAGNSAENTPGSRTQLTLPSLSPGFLSKA